MQYQAVIFDMDGTVLDTLDDLTAAVNHAMESTGHRSGYTREDTRFFFGSGVYTAVRRVLAREAGAELWMLDCIGTEEEFRESVRTGLNRFLRDDEAELQRILTVFRPYYEAHCRDHTAPYPGMENLLRQLRGAGILTAVVSNKPDPAVQILAAEHFPGLFDYTAGERPDVPRKPAPDMVLHVLKQMGAAPRDALYVGDSEIDIQTAAQAGMDCAAVTWGFRDRSYLERLRPDFFADTAEQLLEICFGQPAG